MVFPVTTEAKAIALANSTPYGLGSFMFTTDLQRAQRVADGIEAGMVLDHPRYPRSRWSKTATGSGN
jgi:acyl-CoA reductase-like NAD-dependent aldehyde dehydrogenase